MNIDQIIVSKMAQHNNKVWNELYEIKEKIERKKEYSKMRRKRDIIKIELLDIIFELEYYKDIIEVWITSKDSGIKYLMWGFLKKYEMTKEQIIDASTKELLEDIEYWKEKIGI